MKSEYLVDFIKDEEKEEFKKKVAAESRSKGKGQFTREEVRKQYLEIAKEITNEINKLEDLYEAGGINERAYNVRRNMLFDLRVKNRETYMKTTNLQRC